MRKFPINRQSRDTDKQAFLAYHYPIENTDIEFYGVFMEKSNSLTKVRRPERPTSTEWKTSQKPKFKKLLEKFVSGVSQVPHVARIEYKKTGEKELNIWVLTEERNFELRDQIYDVEIEIMKEFSDFNFNVRVIPDPTKTSQDTKTIYNK